MTARSYAGLGKEERIAQRRERLMDSALVLFSEQGYAKTNIEQLCNHSKVTARHFYELFSSKEDLLLALYQNIIAQLSHAVSDAVSATDQCIEEQVVSAVQALVTHYLQDQRLARIGVLEVVGVSERMELVRRAAIHGIARVIESYLNALCQQAALPARNYELASIALVGGINELMADWLTRENPCSLNKLSDEITYLVLAMVRGAQHPLKPSTH
ncbi:MAG: TetR/AcrR family transcriptional regulator [Moraxellaceae bacterium]|nr:TetR/AcrR family transcriptional regulator [Moraxellaceae bacterium]